MEYGSDGEEENVDEEVQQETVYFDQENEEDANSFVVVSTMQDENFVVAALFGAIEEGNLAGLEELFAMSNIDPSQSNKHGETAVHIAAGLGQLDILKFLHSKRADIHRLDSHGDSAIYWAARQGHAQVIRYLYEQGVRVDTQNKSQETALHVAARYGHADAVEQLLKCGADVNVTDEHGETALHIGVWHGFPKIVHVLCEVGGRTGLRNKEEETPLHCAAARGHTDCVRCLLEAGVELNLVDKNGCTALHLALRRHHVAVALLLLHAGCQIDVVDNQGETAIHIAAKEGLLSIAQMLCSNGCKVDLPNKAGLYPLHLAAKNGHTEVVRCLCLAGCNVEQKNRDGIIAEIAALAQGFSEIGDLLNRLRNDQQREEYISQLVPSSQPISRVKLKLFGHSGVGKTTLLDSLKCGYFSSWFRRSKTSSPVPPNNLKKGSHSSRSSIETNSSGPEEIPVNFNTSNANYTRGIDIQQVNISGVGDLSVWEFSGYESYYLLYDHFIGSINCFHVILFRLSDPYEVQLQQVLFWLSFLRARIPPIEPLGLYGKSSKPAKVLLIGTHADVAGCQRNSSTGEYVSPEASTILQAAQQSFRHIFDIYETILVTDAHVVGSPAMKTLKQYLSNKTKVLQGGGVPKSNGILDAMITHLVPWRKSASGFPVLSWQQFVDMFHLQVNPLAGDDHLKELIQQLQLMGEILYLKSENQDLVVLNPKWLCGDVIGHLLSQEYLEQTRVSGCYSVDDIQLLFPDTDALDLLQVLEAVRLCTQCDNDGEIEYEFPCFNMVEALEGLWEKNDLRYIRGVYGGVRLQFSEGVCQKFSFFFPRFQVQLRRMAQEHPDPENDLYQWFQGSKICSGPLEGLLTLHRQQGEAIEIKVRGPQDMKSECFYFLENLIGVVEQVLSEVCPGLPVEKYRLSPFELREHRPFVTAYTPSAMMRALFKDGLAATLHNENEGIDERFVDIVFFGARNIGSRNLHMAHDGSGGITLAPELQASHLSLLTRQWLCSLIDPPEPMGRDWCMLGVRLGMIDKLPKIDPGDNSVLSPTARVLNEWCKDGHSTIGCLVKKLEELARHEAIDVIMQTAPLLKVFPAEEEPVNDDIAAISDSHTSSSNLSR